MLHFHWRPEHRSRMTSGPPGLKTIWSHERGGRSARPTPRASGASAATPSRVAATATAPKLSRYLTHHSLASLVVHALGALVPGSLVPGDLLIRPRPVERVLQLSERCRAHGAALSARDDESERPVENGE